MVRPDEALGGARISPAAPLPTPSTYLHAPSILSRASSMLPLKRLRFLSRPEIVIGDAYHIHPELRIAKYPSETGKRAILLLSKSSLHARSFRCICQLGCLKWWKWFCRKEKKRKEKRREGDEHVKISHKVSTDACAKIEDTFRLKK